MERTAVLCEDDQIVQNLRMYLERMLDFVVHADSVAGLKKNPPNCLMSIYFCVTSKSLMEIALQQQIKLKIIQMLQSFF